MLSTEQLRLIALSGMVTLPNGHAFDTLMHQSDPILAKSTALKTLKRWWGIENSEDWAETFENVFEGSHEPTYRFRTDIVRLIRDVPGDEAQKQANIYRFDVHLGTLSVSEKLSQLQFIDQTWKWHYGMPTHAFDLGRAATLVRWAVDAEFITENDAWEKLRAVATKATRFFDSWDSFGKSYCFGKLLWADDYSLPLAEALANSRFLVVNGKLLYEPYENLEVSPESKANDQALKAYIQLISDGGVWRN